jgi:Zn2+/Cd2+-exporting ATPase
MLTSNRQTFGLAMQMSCPEGSTEEYEEIENRKAWIFLAALLGISLLVSILLEFLFNGVPLGFAVPILNAPAVLSTVISFVVIIPAAVYVLIIGLKELVIDRRFSVEFLMGVAALGAVYLHLVTQTTEYLFDAGTVLFLYSLAEYFESYIGERARKTVETLSRFMPDKATILTNGTEKAINVNEVKPGLTIIVKPGDRIPLDGNVTEGGSSVDQSLVTGESVPVEKRVGDCVYAGTQNTSGILKVEVTRGAEGTLVSRIVKLVTESRKRKASIERLVDRIARIYVPIVIAIAAFTAIGLPKITNMPFETWLYRSLILLVISCPSAFIISIPATIFTAVTVAARKGILVKGGIYIEKMAKVKSVIFDKTGTLTLGTPIVHDINSLEELDEEALKYAAALERYSNHPLAQTIVKKAREERLDFEDLEVKDVTEFPGKGVMGTVDDVHVIVGNLELMQELNCNFENVRAFYEEEAHTAVAVALDKRTIASICIMDEVRSDAFNTIRELKKDQIYTVMLTGDKNQIANQVAKDLELDEVHSELYPEDKLRILNETKEKHQMVSMVGDGVNDAPALAASDVGIAMGGSRVDAALESADVVLVKDQLIQVPYLIKLSRKTIKIANQNIAASLAIKIALGGLGLFGIIPLWFTVAAGDDGVTMLLLLNTLRLARLKV